MIGKKNQSVIAVIDGLTATQAANIQADILKSKSKHAPKARGIATQGDREDIGKMISSGQKAVMKFESKEEGSNGKTK